MASIKERRAEIIKKFRYQMALRHASPGLTDRALRCAYMDARRPEDLAASLDVILRAEWGHVCSKLGDKSDRMDCLATIRRMDLETDRQATESFTSLHFLRLAKDNHAQV